MYGSSALCALAALGAHSPTPPSTVQSQHVSAVCSVQCAVCSVQYAVCSVQCAVCSVQCAVCSVQCAVCSVQFAVCSVQCAVCSASLGAHSPALPPPSRSGCRAAPPYTCLARESPGASISSGCFRRPSSQRTHCMAGCTTTKTKHSITHSRLSPPPTPPPPLSPSTPPPPTTHTHHTHPPTV
jgi:hypothetical protein